MQNGEDEVLARARAFVHAQLRHDASGHDWWHVERVVRLARRIAEHEGADSYLCELAALLHDVADYKIAGDEETGLHRVSAWLDTSGVEPLVAEKVMQIIRTMSFAGGSQPPMLTLEGQVVQDADRLDAIGAIGVARAFAYGGSRGRSMYDPGEAPTTYADKEAYRSSTSSTINHFYEKLLLLKDRMQTGLARQLARERHQYLEEFLHEFMEEWQGRR
jgi:uncharacterized protein